MKPIVKWAGGKRRLLDEIKNMIPVEVLESLRFGGRLYVEPFACGRDCETVANLAEPVRRNEYGQKH